MISTRTVDYEFRPDVMVIGSMLSELAIAPALQDLIDALASSKCGKITVVSRPFPSIVDNQKNGLTLIALPQVLRYHGKWRLLRWWNSFSKYVVAQALVFLKFLELARDHEIFIFQLSEPFPVALLARAMHKPTIYYVGGSGLKSMLAKARTSTPRFLLAHLIKFPQILMVVLSSFLAAPSWNTIQEAGFGRYAEKTRICGLYVDLKAFGVLKPFVLRASSVGYVGRLEEEKGFRQFVEAVPLVRAKKREIQFVVCGGGSLQSLLKEQTVDREIEFLGLVPNDKMPAVMNELKLLVVPSFTEGFGRVILEAMACGTPVLATGVEGVKALISDGKTGFLIDRNDSLSIARKIVSLMSSPDSLQSVSIEARKYVEGTFTFDQRADSWRRILLDAHVWRQDD